MGYYVINQLKMPLDHKDQDIMKELQKKYGFSMDITYRIAKKSVDARKKQKIQIVYNLNVFTEPIKSKKTDKLVYKEAPPVYETPTLNTKDTIRPVVIGAGPAGLFAALILAEAGARPVLVERGKKASDRLKDVEDFFETGDLNTRSNIQFGEGGAGTFSDGKINTGVKDRYNRMVKIVDTFIDAGAPDEIAYTSKPHIGTDYLVEVVQNIRRKIIALGGEVRFETLVTDFLIKDDKIDGVLLENGESLATNQVILAVGHSARDTFEKLVERRVPMEPKAFAIGLRIEHPQEMIARAQYGDVWQHEHLPVADYKLTYRTQKGRGVYTFCMCPGGFVVNSSSEEGRIVCNGMSNFARDELNANSAVLVNVHPEDFSSSGVLSGVEFQRRWEEAAFIAGGSDYSMPVQTFKSFFEGTSTFELGEVKPNIKGRYSMADLNGALPEFVSEAIKEGITEFGKRIEGFDRGDALLTGVETRSSSPVRLERDEALMSPIVGLYPCGEGAGYAGGIMSAAIDGIKVAESVIVKMNQR